MDDTESEGFEAHSHCPVCHDAIPWASTPGEPDRPPDVGYHGDLVDYCPRCRGRYPHALVKAMLDPFDYALGLSDGTVVRFTEAAVVGDWVRLSTEGHGSGGLWTAPADLETAPDYPVPRGVDVRLADIAWVADAPIGS